MIEQHETRSGLLGALMADKPTRLTHEGAETRLADAA